MEAHEGGSGEDPDDGAKTIAQEICQGSGGSVRGLVGPKQSVSSPASGMTARSRNNYVDLSCLG